MTKFTGDELMRIKTILVEALKDNGEEPYCGAARGDYDRWTKWAATRSTIADLQHRFEEKE